MRAATIALLVTSLAACGDDGAGEMAATCAEAVPEGRTREVTLPGRAFDVAVTSDAYVVGLSSGIASVDPCTLEVTSLCRDAAGVRHLAIAGDLVEYLRHDDTAGACDLGGGGPQSMTGGAADRVRAAQDVDTSGVRARLTDQGVELIPGRERARVLQPEGTPLGLTLSPESTELAVGDTTGTITFYTVPGGLPRGRWNALGGNAYAVAYDGARSRILAAGGGGALALRRR